MTGPWSRALLPFAVAVACAALFAGATSQELHVERSDGLASRKAGVGDVQRSTPLLGTLAQTHTGERVPLDADHPPPPDFDALLADRVTGATQTLDPRLLELLKTMAARPGIADGGAPRIELVSGFRSPKLNEMLRKKGHHVASHSQHSLGHAVDFRIVVRGDGGEVALDPRDLEREIRATGWDGGVGVYTSKDDWFVHADVGPNRHWAEGPRASEP